MSNLVTRTNPLALYEFESQIGANQDLQTLWNGFKVHLQDDSPISDGQPRQIFSTAREITAIASKIEPMKASWMNVLSQRQLNISWPNQPVHSYNFNALMKLAEIGEENFKIDIAEVDPDRDDISKLAKEIANLSAEAMGVTLGEATYEEILKEPQTLCLVAKHEETTVSCIYGTHVTVLKEDRSINVLHFRFLARRADYPSINLIELLKQHEPRIEEKFGSLDYYSLATLEENVHSFQRYEKEGFSNPERVENGFLGHTIFFLTKNLNPENTSEPPTREEVKTAMQQAKKQLT